MSREGRPLLLGRFPLLQERRVAEGCLHLHEENPASEAFKDYCELLYGQALLLEGLTPEDPISFATKVAALMAKSK